MWLDAFSLALAVTVVVGFVALTIDTIVHDDYPEPYDDELP